MNSNPDNCEIKSKQMKMSGAPESAVAIRGEQDLQILQSGASPYNVDAENSNDSLHPRSSCNAVPKTKEHEDTAPPSMTKSLPGEPPTDYSADSLLNKEKIQWIGPQQRLNFLPATSMLQQIYANRESVIRTNVHPTKSFYHEGSEEMLQDNSCSQQSQFLVPGKTDSYSPYSSLSGVGSYADYQKALSSQCSMPSRDKVGMYSETQDYDSYQYNAGIRSQPFPVRPYPVHSNLPTGQYPTLPLGDQYNQSTENYHSYYR